MKYDTEDKFMLKSPMVLGLITTNRCNLKCVHCINSATGNDCVELSYKDIVRLLDLAEQYDIPHIDFNGGEPFIRKDLDDCLNYAISKGRSICITSNGTLITEAWLQKYEGKISLMRISIDSPFEEMHDNFRGERGAFRKTINNIRKARDAGYHVTVLTTISKINQYHLNEMIDLLEDIRANGMHATFLLPAGRGKDIQDLSLSPEEIRKFLENHRELRLKLAKRGAQLTLLEECPQSILIGETETLCGTYKCGTGFTEMVVLNDGYVLPCAAFIGVRDLFRQESLSIYCNDLIDIYRKSNLFQYVRSVHMVEGKCKQCDFLKFCGGGCRAAAYTISGNIFAEDPFCWYIPPSTK